MCGMNIIIYIRIYIYIYLSIYNIFYYIIHTTIYIFNHVHIRDPYYCKGCSLQGVSFRQTS